MNLRDYVGPLGVLAAATLSPGPNNIMVAGAAASAGMRAALRAAIGIVFGGLALISLVAVVGNAVLASNPEFRQWLSWIGVGYLCVLGLQMAWPRPLRQAAAELDVRWRASAARLLALQFVNPKAWALALSVAAAMPVRGLSAPGALLRLAGQFVIVSTTSLVVWSWLGMSLSRWLHTPSNQRRLDRLFGALLIASAVAMGYSS